MRPTWFTSYKNMFAVLEVLAWLILASLLIFATSPATQSWLLPLVIGLGLLQIPKQLNHRSRARTLTDYEQSLFETKLSLDQTAQEVAAQSAEYSRSREAHRKILAGALDQVSKASQQARASVVEVSRASQHATDLTETQAQRALEAIGAFNTAVLAMTNSQNRLGTINEVIEQIAQKIRVVDDVVFKTSLLSFNASIEAARAGEYGRGFSVVASEISKLAESTSVASKEIGQLLQKSLTEVQTIVRSSLDNSQATEQVGIQFAETFQALLAALEDVAPVMAVLSQSATNQEQNCEEALSSVRSLDESLHDLSASERNRVSTAQSTRLAS